MIQTKVEFGVWLKWMLTMLQRGVREAQLKLKIVNCYVKPITVPKEIGKEVACKWV